MEDKSVKMVEEIILKLAEKYSIKDKNDLESLKRGIDFINSSVFVANDNSRAKVFSALIEYLTFKMN